MNQRSALAIAAGITAFVVVLSAALLAYMAQGGPAARQESTAPLMLALEARPTPTDAGSEVQALMDKREANYRQQLEQANRQLEQANVQLRQAYSQLQTQTLAQQPTRPSSDTRAQSVPALGYPVSPDRAATTALGTAPGVSLSKEPQLVNFQGTIAYEVQLDSGPVYIDAQSGRVLYKANVGTSLAPTQARGSGERVRSGDEHEDDGSGD